MRRRPGDPREPRQKWIQNCLGNIDQVNGRCAWVLKGGPLESRFILFFHAAREGGVVEYVRHFAEFFVGEANRSRIFGVVDPRPPPPLVGGHNL